MALLKDRVVIVSDCVDAAVNEMRLYILQALQDADVQVEFEPAVAVAPYSLINCAFLLRLLAEAGPVGLILYVVLNPVRDEPERIIGRTRHKNLLFLGRNTGVFGWLIDDFGCAELYEIPDRKYVPFGGKRIYPKILAAALHAGRLQGIGLPMSPSVIRRLPIADGTVVHIDNFGVAKLRDSQNAFQRLGVVEGDPVQVCVNAQPAVTAVYTTRMMAGEDSAFVIGPGSSLDGMPELASVRGNCAREHNLQIGDIVTLTAVRRGTARGAR